MKYCVVKTSKILIDGSENSKELMIKNARLAGFDESEVEILTEEEFIAIKEHKPKMLTETEKLWEALAYIINSEY